MTSNFRAAEGVDSCTFAVQHLPRAIHLLSNPVVRRELLQPLVEILGPFCGLHCLLHEFQEFLATRPTLGQAVVGRNRLGGRHLRQEQLKLLPEFTVALLDRLRGFQGDPVERDALHGEGTLPVGKELELPSSRQTVLLGDDLLATWEALPY